MAEQRSLLLTDVVGSTALAAALGDVAMAALWAAHDRVARDLLAAHGGREIDKSDGLLLLFEAAGDALAYAFAYHAALARLEPPLAARAGLHTGTVLLRENSAADIARGAKPLEVEGLAKPTAARIMALAQGGQTLLSAAAQAALGATDRWRLQSHGHWRFKGVAEPVEVFEAGDERTAFAPPPSPAEKAYRVLRHGEQWLPVHEVRHNLPAERDAFVGRQALLEQLARRFDEGARLVSVLGIGGAGKTRLATRFALGWLGDFPGGIWFCDLAAARDAQGIVRAVAAALDVRLDGEDDPVAQLARAIAGRGACLVLLDNFEQVTRHAHETLGRWLDAAPAARFLVTSREVLGLAGEQALALAPLPVPEAVALFLRRARAAHAGFRAEGEDQAAIAPLAQLLDGLPLAIELAAARVRLMPPRALLARMSERFKLLASAGGRQDRQATMRAALDWSWELLAPHERAALAQLSVFEGGFTLEAAEAVLDLSTHAGAPWPIDAVQSLLDKSLVRRIGDERFDLFASVRDYAAEHLRTPGRYDGSGPDDERAAQARHGRYYAGLGPLRATEGRCAELHNLVLACRRAVQLGDAATATAALAGAWEALALRGPYRLGLELAEAVATLAPPDAQGAAPAWRCRVEEIVARALWITGQPGADERHERALALALACGDRRCEAEARIGLGHRAQRLGPPEEAKAQYEDALALARQLGEPLLLCVAENALGSLLSEMADAPAALAHLRAGLHTAESAGIRRWVGGFRGNIAAIHATEGRLGEAAAEWEAALAVAREVGDRSFEGNTLCNLGFLLQLQGQTAEARLRFDAALAVAREIGHARLEGVVLCNVGLACESLGQPAEARQRYEEAIVVARALQDRRIEGQARGYLGGLLGREGLHDAAVSCLQEGETLLAEIGDRESLGVLLGHYAMALHLAGRDAEAEGTLARARQLAEEIRAGRDSELGMMIERAGSAMAVPVSDC